MNEQGERGGAGASGGPAASGGAGAARGGGVSGGGGPAGGGAGEQAARLEELRQRIREVDRRLIALVCERRDLAVEIGRLKESMGLPVMDPGQEAKVVRRAAETAREAGGDEELVRDVIWRIIAAARSAQEGRTHWGPPATSGGGVDPREPDEA